MSATSNGNNISGGGDGHAADPDGPDGSVMRMKKRRRPSADRRVDFAAIPAVIPPAARRGRGSS